MVNNKLKVGLGLLTVLATPIAVNVVAGSEVHAAEQKTAVVEKSATAEKTATDSKQNVAEKPATAEESAIENKQDATEKPAVAEKSSVTEKSEVAGKLAEGKAESDEKVDVANKVVTDIEKKADEKKQDIAYREVPAKKDKTEEKKVGWTQTGNVWYYFNAKGQQVKNAWVGSYWLGSDGKMVTDSWVDGGKYYVGSQGWWEKDAVKKTGWTQTGNTWYLYDNEGNIVKNRSSGNYWLGTDGKMVTNSWVDGGKYYVGADGKWVSDALKPGETRKGWTKAGSTWYFFNDKGNQVKNAWVGNYWIGSDGKMVTNSWVDGGKYYVGNDGKWVKGAATGNGSGALNNVLSIAQSYLGVEMGSAEHKKIVDAYNSVNPKPVGYTAKYSDDWCDVFVTTVFQQAGLSSLIGRECGVQRHIGIMQQKGIWQGKVLPKAGDVITFDWDGGGFADHIGIVESVKDGIVTTIEGNSSPYTSSGKTKVNRKTYNWNASYIKGYARPNY
mgnify:CR=1 FL=1